MIMWNVPGTSFLSIWKSSPNSRFNPNSHSFENYFFSSYTLGNVYSENSACMGADGKLIFGTNYGLTIIDPKKIPKVSAQEKNKACPALLRKARHTICSGRTTRRCNMIPEDMLLTR